MKLKAKGSGFRKPRRERVTHWLGLQKEYLHDTYKSRGKRPEPTVCPECGAVFSRDTDIRKTRILVKMESSS